MEIHSPIGAAEHFLSLFPEICSTASDLDGARSALEICSITKTIMRDRITQLEQEQDSNPKEADVSLQEESRIIECGSDLLLLVCSFLHIEEKVQFRYSSLSLHSMLLGCAIDLTENSKIRKLATTEFVLDRFIPLRKFSNRNYVLEACGCSVASTINGFKAGSCQILPEQCNGFKFGCSWSVVGLSLMQESDAEMLPKLLRAIRPNQITKIAISSTSTGILTAIGQAMKKGDLKGLEQIDYYKFEDDDEIEPGYLGTLSSFGPAFHSLDLHRSQTMDISGLENCKSLRDLYLGMTQVADVSVLGSCSSLHTLYLFNTQVADVSALGSCSSLHTLYLGGTQVADVSALGSCSSLHTLDLNGTKVTDISAIISLSGFRYLYIRNTPVANASAIPSRDSLHVWQCGFRSPTLIFL